MKTMKAVQTETLPNPPNLLASLLAGFDAITTHVGLIAFPVLVDLLLWFGPRLKVSSLVESILATLNAQAAQSPESAQLLAANQPLWDMIRDRFNLLIALRAYPVGIPSLMISRLPLKTPVGLLPASYDVGTIWGVLLLWSLVSLVGVAAGTLYFAGVAQVSSQGRTDVRSWLRQWPHALVQVIALVFIWAMIIIAVSIPASCLITALAFGSSTIARLAVLMYGAGLIWLMFPMLFSPHAIFLYKTNAFEAVKNSVRLTRMTSASTGLFFLSALVISQGLDMLWSSTPEDAWLSLIGVIGHAFITTGLVAASFCYYQSASRWVQSVLATRGTVKA
jgi:hypothetical protein